MVTSSRDSNAVKITSTNRKSVRIEHANGPSEVSTISNVKLTNVLK